MHEGVYPTRREEMAHAERFSRPPGARTLHIAIA